MELIVARVECVREPTAVSFPVGRSCPDMNFIQLYGIAVFFEIGVKAEEYPSRGTLIMLHGVTEKQYFYCAY